MECKIKVIKEMLELFPECRPELGKVYDADYRQSQAKAAECAVIDVNGKHIALRTGEFVIVEDSDGI